MAHRQPARDARRRAPGPAGAAKSGGWRSVLLALLLFSTLAYLVQFCCSGGPRATLYQAIATVYPLIPDDFVRELWSAWTGGDGSQISVVDRVPVFNVAVLLLAAAWGCGRLLLPRSAAERLSGLELCLFSLGIGLNVWSLYLLLAGPGGGLGQPWLFRLPMVAAIALGGWKQWHDRRARLGRASDASTAALPRGLRPLVALAVPVVILYLLTAALPPWEFDVREYHLQVPKEWRQQGAIGFLPHNVYGNMPLGAEMQALAGMMFMSGPLDWWWGALAGKVVLGSLPVWTALALFAFGRRFFSPLAGGLAAVIYLSIPWVFYVSTVGLIETAVGFYLWMTFHAVAIALDDGSLRAAHRNNRSGLALLGVAGFLAGSAAACKYPGLIFVGLPVIGFLCWRRTEAQLKSVALFTLMLTAGCGPWFVKNAVLTGNPTYPLLYRVFGGQTWNDEKNARWERAHGPPRDASGRSFTPQQLAASLADLAWNSDKLSPLLLPLAGFCLLVNRRRRLLGGLAALLAVDFAVWWLLTHRVDRFFVPAFPLAAMLAGVGATWSQAVWWRRSVYAAVVAGLLLNLLVIASGHLTGDNRILAPLDALRLDRQNQSPAHLAHRYLSEHVPADRTALLVGEADVFDIEVECRYNTCWDDCLLESWLRGRSRAERLEILKQHRVSHVFVHWAEIDRYRSPGNYGFTDYVTPDLIHRELVDEQRLLRPVAFASGDIPIDPSVCEIFAVAEE